MQGAWGWCLVHMSRSIVGWFPKAVCCSTTMFWLWHSVADFIFSLSEPNELYVGPEFDDIPSQDAAKTVANYC